MRGLAVLGVCLLSLPPVWASPVPADERFTLQETQGGLVRLDRTTGALSLCTTEPATGLVCRLGADERAAYEAKLTALTDELKTTKDALQALRDIPADLAGPAEAKPKGFVELLLARMIHSVRRSAEGKAEPAPKAR